jgi:small-conductance mechanosensitive channel
MNQAEAPVGEALEEILGLGPELQGKLLLSLLLVLAVWGLRWLLLRVVGGKVQEPRARYQWSKGSGYAAFLVALLFLGYIWFEAVRAMGTFLGLLTAGLAIALRDLVANMAGWAFIILRHPFTVGDRVQVGEHRGDVVDIRLFQFTILEVGNWVRADQSTGRIIHIPNSRIFSDPLANYTAEFPFVWHEIPVLVTFESDWKRAKEIVHRTVQTHAGPVVREASDEIRQASRKLLIFYSTLTPTVYTSVEDSGVLLTARFICHVRRRRGLAQAIWEDILDGFAGEKAVDLAYPTRRLYSNLFEGKEGARAELPERLGDLSGRASGDPSEHASGDPSRRTE